MLKEKMQEGLNKQITAEFYSGYLYLAMADYCESLNLKGFAHWFRKQRLEELSHAMKIYDFVVERRGRVTLAGIDGPPVEWTSPKATFEEAYKHELKVTAMINDLVDLSADLKDNATNNFLQWFVEEQVEEEATAYEIVQKLKLIGDAHGGLYIMDKELGKR